MLRKLRLRLVALSMALITALLAVVVYAAFFTARQNLEGISTDVLYRAIREEPGKAPPDIGAGEVVLPYFTVNIWNGTAYVTGGTYDALENTETLSAILNDCLRQPEEEGELSAYGLRYLRQENGWHTRIAFVDMSMENAALRKLFVSWLLIALGALIPLFGVSVLLSRRAVAPVEAAMEQQRRFLSDASHELKTPLTVILSNAELLEGLDLPERPRRWAENIHSESRRMKALVEEMLVLARSEHGEAAAFGEVSLSDVAADRALAFEPVAFEAGKRLRYEIDPGVTVSGDGEKLHRLISILLDNAIKYSADGGMIALRLKKTERAALLTVSNPGEPIPPEKLPHLFERFYRGDAARESDSGSFGLGLSIAAAIAREHRGSIRAESDPVSTRFTCSIPLSGGRRTKTALPHEHN